MHNANLSSGIKCSRVLQIYTKLLNGEVINKAQEDERYGVNQRSIQRDIEDLRNFFENQSAECTGDKELVYDSKLNGYCLRNKNMAVLTNSEVLAVCKILLESRAFRKDDITPIIGKLMTCCIPQKNQQLVKELISNELHHYVEPKHGKRFINSIWDIGLAVKEHRFMQITYEKQDGSEVERLVKPVGIMFSEFYFYLTAFIEGIDKEKKFENRDDIFPTIYRIDRIKHFDLLDKHFVQVTISILATLIIHLLLY
jgi:predicted DNA-binding transcriptional regulator YafY